MRRLLDLQPDTGARAIRDDGEHDVPVAEVEIGMRVRIRPGECIPLDEGVIDSGSAVDQSLVTGEPLLGARRDRRGDRSG